MDVNYNQFIMKKTFLLLILLISGLSYGQRNSFKNLNEKDGKIGIGTKTPDELLTVKGTIHSQEVRVDLQGAVAPDYVFGQYFEGRSDAKPEYVLISLEELERCIKQNHHLPKIPSASEMEENGISLKEMNLLLLEKIEELTLYTIQQQKEINNLKLLISEYLKNEN